MTLHFYLARRFFWAFMAVFGALLLLSLLIGMMEQIRRYGGEDVTLTTLMELTLLSTPEGIYRILPLIMVIATLTLFLQLARTSELVVARAAGRSALRSMMAPAFVALALGAVAVGVMNPIVAGTLTRYESAVSSLKQNANTLAITEDGLWLRQGNAVEQTVINAARANLDGTQLFDVTFLTFTPEGTPQRRVNAASARLIDGAWQLRRAKEWPLAAGLNAEANAVTHDTFRIASDLTPDRIRDSFGTPSAIPIWDLPQFISQLETAGFSARRHLVWYHMEIALPAFLVAMMMIGAGFTMRHTRVSRTGLKILMAIMVGFGLYFIRNFAQILGENGQLPALLAAWAPPLGAIGLALGILLHLEDG